jgi:hypothetical protein
MDQSQLQAYLHLIQQLLACPRGEEWIVLRQNEGLVTPDLVQVMEQVATQLDRQGNPREAKFLHNLGGQLHHLFVAQTLPTAPADDRQQAYLRVIQELLDCPQGQEGQVLAQHRDLLGPGLVRTMQQVANQLAANGDTQAAEYLHQWSQELARLWLEQQDFQPPAKPAPAGTPEVPTDSDSIPPPAAAVVPPTPTPTVAVPAPVGIPPSPDLATDLWASEEKVPRALASPAPTIPTSAGLAEHLQGLTAALTQLNQTLQTQTQAPANPLWYMEVLEQACSGDWLLTSDEVQHLIGVKPTCPRGEDHFQRGCWVFVKAGKLGSQTAWQVEKHH